MQKPQSINPVEWAEYNRRPEGKDHPQPTMVVNNREWPHFEAVLGPEIDAMIASTLRDPPRVQIVGEHPAARILEEAINRAVRDLEGQGSRSDRVALQLLTALALYAAEVGK